MKRILIIFSLLAMMTGVASAQNSDMLNGTWTSTQGNLTQSYTLNAANGTVKAVLSGTEHDAKTNMDVTVTMSMDGTFTLSYPTIHMVFNKETVNIDDLDISIPGMAFPPAQLNQIKQVMMTDKSFSKELTKDLPTEAKFTILSIDGDSVKVADDAGEEVTFTKK